MNSVDRGVDGSDTILISSKTGKYDTEWLSLPDGVSIGANDKCLISASSNRDNGFTNGWILCKRPKGRIRPEELISLKRL
jgi:hypothetical protein